MSDPGLNDFQVEVLRLFFSLPESDGFVLAGGAGLVATGLSLRPTEDLDLFTSGASVAGAGDALEAAVGERGWGTERLQESPTFRRLVITSGDDAQVLVDLAQDSAPLSTATITPLGPTYPPKELAARKILALFGRAALRDFVDVATVAARYDPAELLRLAAEIDIGFDLGVLREMLASLDRFEDDEIQEFRSSTSPHLLHRVGHGTQPGFLTVRWDDFAGPMDERRSRATVGALRGDSREHLAMDHGVSERDSGGKSWVLGG